MGCTLGVSRRAARFEIASYYCDRARRTRKGIDRCEEYHVDKAKASGTVEELTGRLAAAAREIVPWFLEQMPESYFEDIDATSRLEHMGAILALRAVGRLLNGDMCHCRRGRCAMPMFLTRAISAGF
jgi:hypothetical protein